MARRKSKYTSILTSASKKKIKKKKSIFQNIFKKSQTKRASKYTTILKPASSIKSRQSKRDIKRAKKYESILKKSGVQKTKQTKKYDKTTQKSTSAFKKLVKLIDNKQTVGITQFRDPLYKMKLKQEGLVKGNTADIVGKTGAHEQRWLTSSWIDLGDFVITPDGEFRLTIHISNKLASGRKKHYEYTYKVTNKKVWEEMKKGNHSKGAGTFFHENEEYLVRIKGL